MHFNQSLVWVIWSRDFIFNNLIVIFKNSLKSCLPHSELVFAESKLDIGCK